MERIDISKLSKNRSVFLKVGFICSLGFATLALNWTTTEKPTPDLVMEELSETMDIEVVRTVHKEKTVLPPPVVKASNEITIDLRDDFSEEITPDDYVDPDLSVIEGPVVAPPKEGTPPPPPPMPAEIYPEIEEYFTFVEEMPVFGACGDELSSSEARRQCSDNAILSYFARNIRYPALARENNIQGTVIVEFIIDKSGKVIEVKALRDIGGGCGVEALRVANSMPDWIPGRQGGRNVKVMMRLPVHFRLQ